MAFWGRSFMFNGIPSEDFDLIMYDVGSNTQSTGKFASGVTVIEDKLPNKWKPYFYGVKNDNKLEFSIIFGVNQHRIDTERYLDRYELDTIASWLTGHSEYLWLEIEQSDLEYTRYKCVISALEFVEFGNIPWALKATVICDSPYAYLYPQTFEYDIDGTQTVVFYNESSHNGFYMPKIEIVFDNNAYEDVETEKTISIINSSDNDREFSLTNLPSIVTEIAVDNDCGIITSPDCNNLYPYFNFKFLRLLKGDNVLTISGNCTLRFLCEFPINVGG